MLVGKYGYGIGYLRILSDTFANQVSVTSGTKWNCHTFANQYPDGDDRYDDSVLHLKNNLLDKNIIVIFVVHIKSQSRL